MKTLISQQRWETSTIHKLFYVEDDLVVGTIVITQYDGNDVLNISGVYVHENYRRKGIASQMLRDNLDDSIPYSLEVNRENKAAIQLYEKFGFHYWEDSNDNMIWMKDFNYKYEKTSRINRVA